MILVFGNKKQKSAGIQKDGGFFPRFLACFYFLILFTMTKTAREISFDKL